MGAMNMKLILRSDGTGKLSRESIDELEIVFICGCTPDHYTCTMPMADFFQIPCPHCNKVYTFRVADFFQNRVVQTTETSL